MDRQQAHKLLDRLDPGQFAAIGQLLVVMADPVTRALLQASPDDEPVTEKDRHRFQAGQAKFAQNEGTPIEDVMNEFGLKPEEFPLSPDHAG
jgi:hypothetical protein